MPAPKQRPATYADIEALSPHVSGEIIFGTLYTQPRPTPRHERARKVLGFETSGPFDLGNNGPGGWFFLDEPELHLSEHIVVPDLAGWQTTDFSPFTTTAFVTNPPDWLAEILSPSTQGNDRTYKFNIYASHGVAHCWNVDPQAKTLEVFELRHGRYTQIANFNRGATVCAPPFTAHSFELDRLWIPGE